MVDTIRRARALKAALKVERDLMHVEDATVRDVLADLETARKACVDTLSRNPKDWQIAHAQASVVEIERQMTEWERMATAKVGATLPKAVDLGAEQVMGALHAGEVSASIRPMIPTSIVATAYQSLPHLISDVRVDTVAKVGRVIRQAVLAQQTPLDAMKAVGRIVGPTAKGPFRNAALRAEAIVRTELGRVAQQANYATGTALAAEPANAGMMSEWVSAGDFRTRPDHAKASGQRVPYGSDFTVGGFKCKYPHDPRLPAGESINCRCVAIPWHPDYDDSKPVKVAQRPALVAETPKVPAYTPPVGDKHAKAVHAATAAVRAKCAAEAGMEQDAFEAAVLDRVRAQLAKAELRIRAPMHVASKIVADGRFKSQFEARGSMGLYDPKARRECEAVLFGFPAKLAPAQRPVYGYLAEPGVESTGATNYGGATFVLKPSAKARATFQMGDSLGSEDISGADFGAYARGVAPVNAPTVDALSWNTLSGDKMLTVDNLDGYGVIYAEAQVHGGVTLDDVAEVRVPGLQVTGYGWIDGVWGPSTRPGPPPPADLVAWCKEHNVPLVVTNEAE